MKVLTTKTFSPVFGPFLPKFDPKNVILAHFSHSAHRILLLFHIKTIFTVFYLLACLTCRALCRVISSAGEIVEHLPIGSSINYWNEAFATMTYMVMADDNVRVGIGVSKVLCISDTPSNSSLWCC